MSGEQTGWLRIRLGPSVQGMPTGPVIAPGLIKPRRARLFRLSLSPLSRRTRCNGLGIFVVLHPSGSRPDPFIDTAWATWPLSDRQRTLRADTGRIRRRGIRPTPPALSADPISPSPPERPLRPPIQQLLTRGDTDAHCMFARLSLSSFRRLPAPKARYLRVLVLPLS
jgi:hypothetical protein